MSEKQQRLVFAIIEFLNQAIQDGTVKADDQEGLEVASPFLSLRLTHLRDLTTVYPTEQSNASERPLA